MRKVKVLINFLAIAFAFFLNLGDLSIAGDCADVGGGIDIPTIPADYNYSEDWFSTLAIYSGGETIDPNDSVALWVDTEGWGCPPYSWSASDTGYSLDNDTTYNDFETVILTSDGGT